jgi:hypothetical protein
VLTWKKFPSTRKDHHRFDGAWLTWELLLLQSPATTPEKCLLAVLAAQLGTPRERYDEHIGKFLSIVKPRFNRPIGKKKPLLKVDASWLW